MGGVDVEFAELQARTDQGGLQPWICRGVAPGLDDKLSTLAGDVGRTKPDRHGSPLTRLRFPADNASRLPAHHAVRELRRAALLALVKDGGVEVHLVNLQKRREYRKRFIWGESISALQLYVFPGMVMPGRETEQMEERVVPFHEDVSVISSCASSPAVCTSSP